ncbi:2-amino-4-hydroxy-6-hydroxymethyldihydropteridine diphosphokinase [Sulfurimonas paralvinellae]|uniref:2-amino-4-hydroxy-6-hydroxymethyldihydropteridine pyrophosphokinase n=1 Tax=Sulfurimonas paralvinellae TaxID=317658 RepID=A0A7M1B6K9_9BACT|nr:2-amino-4-hydroxy-6-hydroxymethyldihydropteridine diphosphokinase [Sulfurimonas paralvinellae]QOP45285.1 2-amino-4-hydroxy-6-hydroxymethyldihydropteridine diphosphokinase [Sulfurimonas paralvinellae]
MYRSRRVREDLTSFYGGHFPYAATSQTSLRYEVTVGIGGNLGDVRRRFEHLFFALKRERQVEVLRTSLILKNPPFGYKEQDDFFNAIIVLKTSMQPKEFLRYLHRVEKRFGRRRSFANAPRTLDLDIIFFDNREVKTKDLTIPHAAWFERESVLIPLAGVK